MVVSDITFGANLLEEFPLDVEGGILGRRAPGVATLERMRGTCTIESHAQAPSK